MACEVIFHRLVQQDMNDVRQYYIDEVGERLADRFYEAFLSVVDRAGANPKYFHEFRPPLRRANIPKFPYHFLFRETLNGIRILVLRHDKRHPSYGLSRK